MAAPVFCWNCSKVIGFLFAVSSSKILRSIPIRTTAIWSPYQISKSTSPVNIVETYCVHYPLECIILRLQGVGKLSKLINDLLAGSLSTITRETADLFDCSFHVVKVLLRSFYNLLCVDRCIILSVRGPSRISWP